MALTHGLDEMDKPQLLVWLFSCQHPCGGFGGNEGHDPHMLYTLSAVQILAIFGELDRLDVQRTAAYVAGLQQPGACDWWKKYCTLVPQS